MKYTATITFDHNIDNADLLPDLAQQVINHFSDGKQVALGRSAYNDLVDDDNEQDLEGDIDDALTDIENISNVGVTLTKSQP